MAAAGRLFFALWPDAGLALQLEAVTHRLAPDWQPVARADLHLTVLFLGAVPTAAAAALCQAVDTLSIPAFEQPLTRLECWAAGTVCCCAGDAGGALEMLHHQLAAAAARVGLPLERRRYVPHVTLARRTRPSAVTPTLGRPALALDMPLRISARCLLLADSAGPQREGSRYRALQTWPLGPPRSPRFPAKE